MCVCVCVYICIYIYIKGSHICLISSYPYFSPFSKIFFSVSLNCNNGWSHNFLLKLFLNNDEHSFNFICF